jgi:hypothetical protein
MKVAFSTIKPTNYKIWRQLNDHSLNSKKLLGAKKDKVK